ncbi:MAG: hypothetical protein IJN77_05415 [Oscillospiraceae bacterium]|nr:hypothetical protein [Oscillospiraceae bacterium]MBR6610576.1 hypothetical protein [Oscillospiraceae bacterium]
MIDYKAKYEELSMLCHDFVNKVMDIETRDIQERMNKKIQEAGGLVEYFNKLAEERETENIEDIEE